jgi:hypothetical protein
MIKQRHKLPQARHQVGAFKTLPLQHLDSAF